jgi:hypothetical protein
MQNDLTSKFDEFYINYLNKNKEIIIKNIRRKEKENSEYILKIYGRGEGQFEVFYDLLYKVLFGINYIKKDDWGGGKTKQYLIAFNNLKIFYSAYNQLVIGNHDEFLILIRSVYEALIAIIFISKNPERADAVFTKLKDGGVEFNITNFITQDLKLKWNEYFIFSSKTHFNKIKVVNDLIDINFNKIKYPINPVITDFDKNLFETGLNQISIVMLLYFQLTLKLFISDENEKFLNDSMIDDCKQVIELKEEELGSHNKEYLPRVVEEIRNIIKSINSH